MDYISAIGTLCVGNGLSEILYAVFGSVEKCLQENYGLKIKELYNKQRLSY